jgi:NAD(P)H-hydrate epimerase
MIVLTPDEMRRLDKKTDEIFGLSLRVLMENAGRGILRFIEEKFRSLKKITFICGKGNNGGDGFVTARYLKLRGYDVVVYTFGEKQEYRDEALLNLNLLEKTGCEIKNIDEESLLKFDLGTSDLVVDGVFGTGFKGELKEDYREIFRIVNEYSQKLVSIDIPSGVDGETGFAGDSAINADYTLTFAYPKTGHYLYPGKIKRGKLYLVDIGIPYYYAEEEGFEGYIITFEIAKQNMPERMPYFHKGNCGKVFVLSGSKGYTGAPSMVAMGALKSGAGLVFVGIPEELNPILEQKLTEAITVPLPGEKGLLSKKSIPLIFEKLEKIDVCVAGPGLGRKEEIKEIICEILEKWDGKLILDADAVPLLKNEEKLIKGYKGELVMTPHPGELGTFLDRAPEQINNDRLKVAEEVSLRLNKTFVLKGAPTIISTPSATYINTTGNDGLATGGTGDVLAGIIAGLSAQNISISSASISGVFLHGLCADILKDYQTTFSIIATDLLDVLPEAIKRVLNTKKKKRETIMPLP